ncbi:hypothetical protein JCM17960_19880 [Magnetospira thiophila]
MTLLGVHGFDRIDIRDRRSGYQERVLQVKAMINAGAIGMSLHFGRVPGFLTERMGYIVD